MSDEESQMAEESAALLKSEMAKCRGKLGACTRKINETREMLIEGGNREKVEKNISKLYSCAQDLKYANESVCALIADEAERKDDQNNWYEPKVTYIASFLKEVDIWKENEQQRLQATKDSISIVSKTSRTSIASATKLAAAEKAALEARSKALPAIHAIEMEEAALKSRKERIELQLQIEAVDAKLKALSVSEEQEGDAMNEYNNASKDDNTEPVADASATLGAVPKPLLQKAVRHMHSSSRGDTRGATTNPQANASNDPTREHRAMLQGPKELMDLMRQQNLSLLPK
ncbi:hypothetical protein N1851_006695 [Merluccius polli]|uniref:Uncharacterized protein n=1 Tax=Merluccius polli TaxID=89951 RepID=A0AA47P8B0_MERPO|nr:hypothetical protein N1851_006695 [Merluccius polli]